ncbi:hypothetical protein IC757_09360 [Wenzhouxiangella sp. AB-CW3]|uniref:hypothetical protein n=1 Tax=Wenzhouxiangella sp. AB-CW3 TaxID=2771012 RepID=UPI00168A79F0|nr:hypothetical protein [Wenzhouxiangella sp. AB-CW3]QOC21263.1 hypothetical protein IC757_09360 [Wenzhouxiangella sp. AB-CW3]
MPDTLTLSVLHTQSKDLTVMRSLLKLVGGEINWEVTDGPGGDFTIIDVDEPEGARVWQSLKSDGIEPVALTRQRNCKAALQLRKPMRSRQFIDLLHRLAAGDAVPDSAEGIESTPRWESLTLDEERAEFTLAEHLRRGSWTAPVVLTIQGWPEIIIDPGSGTWCYDGSMSDMTPAMFAQRIPKSAAERLNSNELARRMGDMHQRSLSELKWFAGLAQSRGKLHPDLLGEFEFMLAQVPPQAVGNPRFQRLAKVLIRGPVSIDRLHEETGEPVETVTAFLNACHTCGRLLINHPVKAVSF